MALCTHLVSPLALCPHCVPVALAMGWQWSCPPHVPAGPWMGSFVPRSGMPTSHCGTMPCCVPRWVSLPQDPQDPPDSLTLSP